MQQNWVWTVGIFFLLIFHCFFAASPPMISLVTFQTQVHFWGLKVVKHSSPRKFPFSVLMHYKKAGPFLSILKASDHSNPGTFLPLYHYSCPDVQLK